MGQLLEAYPLKFQPVFRSYIWGGRRLQTSLAKPLPDDGRDYAESWEVVDHGDDQSVVLNGALRGYTLSELVRHHGEWLFGRHHPQSQFPLLFKFLDCQRNLSVQVHPNDQQAGQLDPPDRGKTEAWLILSAAPGSVLYAGLADDVDERTLRSHIGEGTVDQALHSIHPQTGDCIFVPAGTVHALGEGLLVAEIQQSSDTTFRLFDWNRVDQHGNARPLHVEQALGVIDFEQGPVEVRQPIATGIRETERLVECPQFVLDRIRLSGSRSMTIGGDDRFHIMVVIEGTVAIDDHQGTLGQTVLLPAASQGARVESSSTTVLLDIYLP